MQALDARKATILRAIVRDYVRTGQPVGSQALARRYRLKVSAATVRNEMAALEELGYIAHPYTSAGRIPTDLGYRWFIDHWPSPSWPQLSPNEKRAIEGAYRTDFLGLDEALEETSQVLSDVTEATSVVVAPPARRNLLRRIELLPRDGRRATLLLIADTGIVEQGVVEFPSDRSAGRLAEVVRALNPLLGEVAFEDLTAKLRAAGGVSREDREVIAGVIDRIVGDETAEKIFRGGTANILSPNKFSDIETAHEVVDALEQPPVLSTLLEAVRNARTVLVFIGEEVPVEQMRACAVIFAPYVAGAGRRGTLGVVGPTRMDYPHTISAVEAVARSLSALLDPERS